MNQNNVIALGLSALVIGGLALLRKPSATVVPTPRPGTEDRQFNDARRRVEMYSQQLEWAGGGSPAQREQIAAALEVQATALEGFGQSPQTVALLRESARVIRAGQTPVLPPPIPTPVPDPTPPPPTPTPGLPTITPDQVAAIIAAAEAQAATLPPGTRATVAMYLLELANRPGTDLAVRAQLLAAAARISPLTGTGRGAASPPAVSRELTARYAELRDCCSAFLHGVADIDVATLGAADRTTRELYYAGDSDRAANLGELASASYARARIPRPQAVAT